MKYKIGDKVRLISKPTKYTTTGVEKYLGKVVTISGMGTSVFGTDYYTVEEDDYKRYFEDMIAGLASETPFGFDAWKDKNVCMHCKTEEEAEDFCKVMDAAGLRWISGAPYLKTSCFDFYKETTCYRFNKGTYTDIGRAKDNGYTILEWSDYRSTEPPKEEQEKTMETKSNDKPLDFKEAMRIKRRICETASGKCENCYIASDMDCCNDFFTNYTDNAESILKKWAAEHPAKTNRDKFAEVFGEIERFGKCEIIDCSTVPCLECGWWNREYVEPEK